MKHKYLITIGVVIAAIAQANAQSVGINNSGSSAHPSAMLDVSSTNKGLLIPRMTAMEREAIISPAIGLMVYQTDSTAGFHYYNGTVWTAIAGIGGSTVGWTIDGDHMYNSNAGNVGIGTAAPVARLHVADSNVVFTGPNAPWTVTPGDPPISGGGGRMMWYADKCAFRAGFIDFISGTKWNKDNVGLFSAATGYGTRASGEAATAMGNYTTATGDNATSMGLESIASGDNATSLGHLSIASGENSIAMGDNSTASGHTSTAMGNSIASGVFSTSMGNATASGDFAVAMGNGTTASGSASVAMGQGSNAHSDNATAMGLSSNAVGLSSLAAGRSAYAGGDFSIAMGYSTQTHGNASVAMGQESVTSSENAIAIGLRCYAAGFGAFAAGSEDTASGSFSLALGSSASATGDASVAIGSLTKATDDHSTAIGYGATALGESCMALGDHTQASGNNTFAFGYRTNASGSYSSALGCYSNNNDMTGSFAIGDRSSVADINNDANNQMVMRFAGGYKLYSNSDATVGAQLAPGGNSWSTISDIRKKENFSPVNGDEFLKKISKFNLTSWNYKGQDATKFRHYGPMAQDFYAAFGKDSYGTVGNDTTINQADMEGVSFIAIQALVKRTEELQSKVAQLEASNKTLATENNELKAELAEENKKIKNDLEMIKAELISGKISVK